MLIKENIWRRLGIVDFRPMRVTIDSTRLKIDIFAFSEIAENVCARSLVSWRFTLIARKLAAEHQSM